MKNSCCHTHHKSVLSTQGQHPKIKLWSFSMQFSIFYNKTSDDKTPSSLVRVLQSNSVAVDVDVYSPLKQSRNARANSDI